MVALTALTVEINDFAWSAKSVYHDAAMPAGAAILRLNDVLAASGGMAGTDVGGVEWASAYDRAARPALRAGQDAMNACFRLSAMFTQSARNYEAAEAASSARTQTVHGDPTGGLPNGVVEFSLAGHVPSSSGAQPTSLASVLGAVVSPAAGVIGAVLPNGHQDRLHAAAEAWRHVAGALADAADTVGLLCLPFDADQLPEAGDMDTVCAALRGHLTELAGVYRVLAQGCDDYAHHLDVVRSGIEGELVSLAWQSTLIEGVSALLAVPTVGFSEYEGNQIEAGRAAAVAARIAELTAAFVTALRTVAASIAAALGRLDSIAGSLAGLVDVRLSVAIVSQVRSLPVVRQAGDLVALAHLTLIARRDWPMISGVLRDARAGEKMFGLGTVTREQADIIGRAWVGEDARWSSNGTALVSKDGLRQYRPASYKPKLGFSQANLQKREVPSGFWHDNGHLNVREK